MKSNKSLLFTSLSVHIYIYIYIYKMSKIVTITSQCIIFCNIFCQGSGFTHFVCPLHSYIICLVRKVNVRPVSACNTHPHNHGKHGIITEYVLETTDLYCWTGWIYHIINVCLDSQVVSCSQVIAWTWSWKQSPILFSSFFAFILFLNLVPA